MASLFKPSYTKADPVTGVRVSRKVRKWYGKYRDASGQLRCTPLSPNKTAAMAMLTDLLRKIELQKAGLLDPCADHLDGSIKDNLTNFEQHLEGKLRSPRHVSETVRIIENVVLACKLDVLTDLQNAGDRLELHLAKRRRAGVSHRTINGDLVAVRSFCRWLIRRRRMHEDPTRGLERLNQEMDRRRERRALTNAEIEALYSVTRNSKRIVSRLTGQDRALLYLVAVRTGLRRGELQSLTTRSFDFTASPPTVTVEAANSKHRRTDTLPVSPEVASLLQPYLLGRSSVTPVWPGSWWRQASKMLALDLADAGISVADEHGRVIDFHALRTSFITGLARAGVMPAMAQKLARHSDINLTLGVYTQLQLGDLATAVEKLPLLAATS